SPSHCLFSQATSTTELLTLSLHDALPISCRCPLAAQRNEPCPLALNRAQHFIYPVLVVGHVQALVLRLGAAEQRVHADGLGGLVGPFDPVGRTAAHVVPAQALRLIAFLTGAEFLQVIRRTHAADVEEVLVLADALGAQLRGLRS